MKKDILSFRKAKIKDIKNIHGILKKAFEPYKKNSPKKAYDATVISFDEVKERILNSSYETYVILFEKK